MTNTSDVRQCKSGIPPYPRMNKMVLHRERHRLPTLTLGGYLRMRLIYSSPFRGHSIIDSHIVSSEQRMLIPASIASSVFSSDFTFAIKHKYLIVQFAMTCSITVHIRSIRPRLSSLPLTFPTPLTSTCCWPTALFSMVRGWV